MRVMRVESLRVIRGLFKGEEEVKAGPPTPCTLQTRAANISPYNGHTLLLSMDAEQVGCVRGAKRTAKRGRTVVRRLKQMP